MTIVAAKTSAVQNGFRQQQAIGDDDRNICQCLGILDVCLFSNAGFSGFDIGSQFESIHICHCHWLSCRCYRSTGHFFDKHYKHYSCCDVRF